MRLFHCISLSFLIFTSAEAADPTPVAKPSEEAKTPAESTNSGEANVTPGAAASNFSVPNWLLEKPFRVIQKLSLDLDGSPEAGSLKRQTEHESKLLFLDPGHWRFRQELPFSGLARELLRSDEGVFRMTRANRAVAPLQKISEDAWTQLLRLPHDLSKRWGMIGIDSSWSDWIDKVKDLKEEYKNSDGDRIRVTTTQNGDVQKTIVILEGSLPHEDSTRIRVKAEWTLEHRVPVTKDELQKSLAGGA